MKKKGKGWGILVAVVLLLLGMPVRTKAAQPGYLVILKETQDPAGQMHTFLEKLQQMGVEKPEEEYSVLFSGCKLRLSQSEAEEISGFPEVEQISREKLYQEEELKKKARRKARDAASNLLIAKNRIPGEYDGRGMLIAVIDSGADVQHPDFRLDKDVKGKLGREQAETLIKEKGLSGKYVSEKIPFAYDYASGTTEVKENKKESHGMHVAGIIGANPEAETKARAKGVAPNTQLAIMKVFGKKKGAESSSYIRALEDAVLLGADGVNMSLGTGGGALALQDPAVERAILAARKRGIPVAIAGGNDGYFGWGVKQPDIRFPDYGVTAMPGVDPNALTVASLENTTAYESYLEVKGEDRAIIHGNVYNEERHANKEQLYREYREVVDAGLGRKEDVAGLSLEGKITLIARGKIPFREKIANAKEKGADFVLIYNTQEEGGSLVGMDVEQNPVVSSMISYEDGRFLKEHPGKWLRLSSEVIETQNPAKGKLSEFSSWGISAEGGLKPDITAPGGNIYSTLNDATYGVMSGTSMASPHVAGALAVLSRRVAEQYPEKTAEEKQVFLKNLLMNTAVPHQNKEGVLSSPRQQGAGVLNLYNALYTPVIAYGEKGVGSLALGNLKDKADIRVTLENISDREVHYKAKIYLTTDSVKDGRFSMTPVKLGEIDAGAYQVKPGEKAVIQKEIDLTALPFPQTPNGNYLDGFLLLESEEDTAISIPFSGFVGDWDNLAVLEPSVYQLLREGKTPLYVEDKKEEKESKDYGAPEYLFTHLSTMADGEFLVLGRGKGAHPTPFYEDSHLAISPNGDGRNDYARFYGMFLRSYQDMQVEVYAEGEAQPLYRSNQGKKGIKNYFGNNPDNKKVTSGADWRWDGTIVGSGQKAPDGKYLFRVQVRPLSKAADLQTLTFPLIVDTVMPEIEKSRYEEKTRTFTVEKIKEELSGVRSVKVFFEKDGKKNWIPTEEKEGRYSCTLPKETTEKDAYLRIEDWANNVYEYPIEDSIRDDATGQILIRTALQGKGKIPAYEVTIYDKDGRKADGHRLKKGETYKVVTTVKDDQYRVLEAGEEEVTIPEEAPTVILKRTFQKIRYFTVRAYVHGIQKAEGKESYTGPIRLKLIHQDTKKEIYLEQDTESSLITNLYHGKVTEGDYRLEAEEVAAGWQARIEKNPIHIEEKQGYLGDVSVRVYYEKEGTPEPDPPVTPGDRPGKIWLWPSAYNRFHQYSAENPILFTFTNTETKEVITHSYGGNKDYLVKVPYGTYRVEARVTGYWMKLEVVEENQIRVDKSMDHETAVFTFQEGEAPTPQPDPDPDPNPKPQKQGKVWIQPAFSNEYTGYTREQPISFVFTEIRTKQTITHTYGQSKDYLVTLPYGVYQVDAKVDGYVFRMESGENGQIRVDDTTLDHETVLFSFQKKQEPQPETGTVRLSEHETNAYRSWEKPICLVFKNLQSQEETEYLYRGGKGEQQKLSRGTYQIALKEKGEWKLTIYQKIPKSKVSAEADNSGIRKEDGRAQEEGPETLEYEEGQPEDLKPAEEQGRAETAEKAGTQGKAPEGTEIIDKPSEDQMAEATWKIAEDGKIVVEKDTETEVYLAFIKETKPDVPIQPDTPIQPDAPVQPDTPIQPDTSTQPGTPEILAGKNSGTNAKATEEAAGKRKEGEGGREGSENRKKAAKTYGERPKRQYLAVFLGSGMLMAMLLLRRKNIRKEKPGKG